MRRLHRPSTFWPWFQQVTRFLQLAQKKELTRNGFVSSRGEGGRQGAGDGTILEQPTGINTTNLWTESMKRGDEIRGGQAKRRVKNSAQFFRTG